eukprot:CAMPEP_0204641546 /NCGR_PEP_ID=MMETSP0717-20131115/51193_1 /ASSEMBLY_ACC=CAM_ASM_000666 /TAXON_ID=230516 /ORGANISM="Chaetoceros curvisetus" /LENGTH=160 /DNA_ID=CAMNT_0051662219 /DNA_START=726 /DNA_END=1208 /DNA_ORIENTATION=+
MATPYPNVSDSFDSEKDNYNFYHSQLRIRIECAFGILCQRFGFLRKKASKNHTMSKIIALVSCLCRIHNFIIEQTGSTQVPPTTADDSLAMAFGGAVSLQTRHGESMDAPLQLLDGGHHFEDDAQRTIRRRRVPLRYGIDMLPRESMMEHVLLMGLRRPR